MTRKIVSEMTYNVSMGTLNPTIPYSSTSCCQDVLKLESLLVLWYDNLIFFDIIVTSANEVVEEL